MIVLLACIAQKRAKQLLANHASNSQDSRYELVDKLVDRTLKVWPLHGDLEITTLGKPGNLRLPFAPVPTGITRSRGTACSLTSKFLPVPFISPPFNPSAPITHFSMDDPIASARQRSQRWRTVISSSTTTVLTGTKLSADTTATFLKELGEQPATEIRGRVDFMKYNDRYVYPPLKGDPSEREVLLYIPGLDFSGISAYGIFPSLASRYELWRCRVESGDRSTYSELADSIVGFVEDQVAKGHNVTLLGESFGGLLTVGVAQRLVKNDREGAKTRRLAGVILVNPATSYDYAPISAVGPALTFLPAQKFDIPILPDAQVTRGSATEKVRPRVSLYSIAAGLVLGVTTPSASQMTNGVQGLLSDVLSPSSSFPGAAPEPSVVLQKVVNRTAALLAGLDGLASRLTPETLSWRLRNWLSTGCVEVNRGLSKLKDSGVPVLVLAGDQDRLLPSVDEARRLERVLGPRTCEAVVLKEIGHACLLDDQVNVLKLIEECSVWKQKRDR